MSVLNGYLPSNENNQFSVPGQEQRIAANKAEKIKEMFDDANIEFGCGCTPPDDDTSWETFTNDNVKFSATVKFKKVGNVVYCKTNIVIPESTYTFNVVNGLNNKELPFVAGHSYALYNTTSAPIAIWLNDAEGKTIVEVSAGLIAEAGVPFTCPEGVAKISIYSNGDGSIKLVDQTVVLPSKTVEVISSSDDWSKYAPTESVINFGKSMITSNDSTIIAKDYFINVSNENNTPSFKIVMESTATNADIGGKTYTTYFSYV